MTLHATIRQRGAADYDLIVNGRLVLSRESHAVCDAVKRQLDGHPDTTEAAEVAARIRDRFDGLEE